MTDQPLKGLRVAVAGAGVLGLGVGAQAARRGAEVVVFDPAVRGDNASGVAAGMLSPALEAALEDGDAARHGLFERAYTGWPRFARELDVPLAEHGAGGVQVGDASMLERLTARLGRFGVRAQSLAQAEVRARQPLYGADQAGLLVSQDGRLDPGATLAAMARALEARGGRLVNERLAPKRTPQGFDRLVIAAGYDARAWAAVAPELAVLAPIKGHILHYALAGRGGPTLRGEGGYLAPQADQVVFGATMEAGRADRMLDPSIAAELHRRALDLAPALDGVAWTTHAAVRAATPDGAPLVGASAGGAVLATGARRNGWLLAPLIVEAAVEALQGAAPWPAFDPARFSRT